MGVTVTFIAILELMREGLIDIVQAEPFAPLHVRAAAENRKLRLVANNDRPEERRGRGGRACFEDVVRRPKPRSIAGASADETAAARRGALMNESYIKNVVEAAMLAAGRPLQLAELGAAVRESTARRARPHCARRSRASKRTTRAAASR